MDIDLAIEFTQCVSQLFFGLEGRRKPAPVSYTHLDVYKRQDVDGEDGVRMLLALIESAEEVHVPVSYTHLDVYKRQVRTDKVVQKVKKRKTKREFSHKNMLFFVEYVIMASTVPNQGGYLWNFTFTKMRAQPARRRAC